MIDHLRRLVLALAVFIVAAFFFSFIRSRIEGYGLMDLWRGKGPASEGFLMPVASRLSAGDVHVLTQLDDEYARLADVILPAVVSIDTKTVRRKSIPFPIVGLRAFQDYMAPGKGSGAIISHEGHVVTNYHVIEGASSVVITLSTNEKLNARVLEGSQECDIALLKIDSKRTDFPALSLGDSNHVRTGQLVFAVGNPFGLSGTITQGIISARDRIFTDSAVPFFQTDTVINRGSSGGPLINVKGEIIGINVALYKGNAQDDTWQGVGLAIPAHEVKLVVDAVLATPSGKAAQQDNPGYLGVILAQHPVTIPGGEAAGTIGVQVQDVPPGSPAAEAGLLPADIITAYNGSATTSPEQLLATIKTHPPGSKIHLTVWRTGELGKVDAVLGGARKPTE